MQRNFEFVELICRTATRTGIGKRREIEKITEIGIETETKCEMTFMAITVVKLTKTLNVADIEAETTCIGMTTIEGKQKSFDL